jgi:hypothetical protein
MLRPNVIMGAAAAAAVYNNMGDDTCTLTTSNLASPCFGSWSWDVTKCTDMLPFSVESRVIRGTFMQVSSVAMALEVTPGSVFELSFPTKCSFRLRIFNPTDMRIPVVRAHGPYNWTRASRTSPTDGIGGNNMYATLELSAADDDAPAPPMASSVWIAREKEEGSFQSDLGIASFTFVPGGGGGGCVSGHSKHFIKPI